MALDVPVYHLDGVVQNRSERESFDGPLDLILLLLSKNKMEIADIQIALILDAGFGGSQRIRGHGRPSGIH